jgi:hypothetical protein
MKCSINIDKITSAIKEKIATQVPTNLFSIQGDTLVPSEDIGEVMFEPNMDIVNEAVKFSGEVKESHREYLENEPVMFLKQLAYSASVDETEALDVASPYIVGLAKKLFPYEGKESPHISFINKINKDFKADVLVRIAPNKWKMDVPKHLSMAYAAMDPDGFETVAAYAREEYIKKMGISVNLIEEHNWVNFRELADPKLQTLMKFMKKLNPKARVSMFADLDAKAVSLISDYIIMLKAGDTFEEIPHEVAHFFLELLPDSHPLKKEMLKSIIDLPKYAEVYRKYKDNIFYQKNGKPDIDKIKREAAAQLIGDYVNAAFTDKADEKYGKKRSFIKRLVNGILKAIRKLLFIKVPVYYEHTQNPFKEAAQQIINQDISQLDLKRAPTPYDSIFFSIVEDNKEEGHELGPVVKQLQIFTSAMKNRLGRLFNEDLKDSKYDAFRQELQDGDINKAYAIIDRMKAADDILKLMLSDTTFSYISIINALENVAASYKAFEVLPHAIKEAVKVMLSKQNGADDFLNNMRELADYSNMAQNFDKLTKELQVLLRDLKLKFPGETDEDMRKKERLLDLVKSVIEKGVLTFKEVEATVEEEFKRFYTTFIQKYAGTWTEDVLKNTIKGYNEAEHGKLKDTLLKQIYSDPLLNKEAVWKMLTNRLNRFVHVNPTGKLDENLKDFEVLRGGLKVDMSPILDTDNIDMGIFFGSSPALLKDPLVTTTVKFIIESILKGKTIAYGESISFLRDITPLQKKTGMEWYDLNNMLQDVQPIFSPSAKDKMREVRVFLSETKRFQFFFDKSVIQNELSTLQSDLGNLNRAWLEKPGDAEIVAKIKEKQKEIADKKEELNNFLKEWSNRPYTNYYYDTIAKLNESRGDSETLKQVKILKQRIRTLRNRHSSIFMLNIEDSVNIDFSDLESFIKDSMELAMLERKLSRLQQDLPPMDKALMEEVDALYTVDEKGTERIRANHKEKVISDALAKIKEARLYANKTDSEIRNDLEKSYNAIYKINRPTEEFWKVREEIYNEISELMFSAGEFTPYKFLLEDIRETEKRLKKNLYTESGEIDLFSAMFIELDSDKTLISEFKQLEQDSSWFRTNARNIMTYINATAGNPAAVAGFSILAGLQYISYMSDALTKYENYLKNGESIDFAKANIKNIEDKIKEIFKATGDISDVELKKLIDIVRSSPNLGELGDKLNTINFGPKTFEQQAGIGQARALLAQYANTQTIADVPLLEGVQSIIDILLSNVSYIKSNARRENEDRLNELFAQLDEMAGRNVTHNYTMMMQSFLAYADQYLKDDTAYSSYKTAHQEAYDTFMKGKGDTLRAAVYDWEKLLGGREDGLFVAVVNYMANVSSERVSDASNKRTEKLEGFEKIKSEYKSNLLSALTEYLNNPKEETRQNYFNIFGEYLSNDEYDKSHVNKLATIIRDNLRNQKELKEKVEQEVNKFIDGYEESVEREYKLEELSAKNLAKLIEFYNDLHTTRIVRDDMNPDGYEQFSPLRLVTKFEPTDEKYYTEEYPKFLTYRVVKDEHRTEKIYDTDPRVISGQVSATVDINGNWLPLPKKGKYWNDKYHELKNNPSKRPVFELLEKLKLYSLQRQQELLEQDRFDLRIPAMRIDEYEEIKLLKNPKKAAKYAAGRTPFSGWFNAEKEARAELENIGLATQQVYDRFSGGAKSRTEDDDVKLQSIRNIPIDETSADAIAALTMFITDLNVYKQKNFAKPIVKAIRDMYISIHERSLAGKNRANLTKMLYDGLILDKIPESIFNLPQVANFVNFAMSIAGLKLAGDIVGSAVNVLSGEAQLIIESMIGDGAMDTFRKASAKSLEFFSAYEKDYFNAGEHGLHSQMIMAFNMLPGARNLQSLLSWKNMASGVRTNLMKIRSEPENALGIQTAITIIMRKSNIVDNNGRKLEFYDLYTLKDGVIALKDEYSYMKNDWDPVNGEQVKKLRSAVLQFYTLLHGNYYDHMQSWISRYSVGRAFEMMKKYMIPMLLNRYQGRVMDVFLERERIGNHRAFGKLLAAFVKGFIFGKDEEKEYYKWMASNPLYKHAARRSITEIAMLILMGILIPMVFGYDDDDDERNKKLSKMSWEKQVALLIALRVQGELGTFIPLPVWGLGYMEMKRAIFDPFGVPKSAVDNMSAILKYSFQHLMGDTNDLYYKNKKKYNYWWDGIGAIKDKGDSKLMATLWNTIGYTGYTFEPAPYIMTFTQIQNKVR